MNVEASAFEEGVSLTALRAMGESGADEGASQINKMLTFLHIG